MSLACQTHPDPHLSLSPALCVSACPFVSRPSCHIPLARHIPPLTSTRRDKGGSSAPAPAKAATPPPQRDKTSSAAEAAAAAAAADACPRSLAYRLPRHPTYPFHNFSLVSLRSFLPRLSPEQHLLCPRTAARAAPLTGPESRQRVESRQRGKSRQRGESGESRQRGESRQMCESRHRPLGPLTGPEPAAPL